MFYIISLLNLSYFIVLCSLFYDIIFLVGSRPTNGFSMRDPQPGHLCPAVVLTPGPKFSSYWPSHLLITIHVLHGFFSISKRSITADTSAPREWPLPITRYPHDRMPNCISYSNSARVIRPDLVGLGQGDSAIPVGLGQSDPEAILFGLGQGYSKAILFGLGQGYSAILVGLGQRDSANLFGLGQGTSHSDDSTTIQIRPRRFDHCSDSAIMIQPTHSDDSPTVRIRP